MIHNANKTAAKMANCDKARRVAFKDVSNHVGVERSKKAAEGVQKRNIESVYPAVVKPADAAKGGAPAAEGQKGSAVTAVVAKSAPPAPRAGPASRGRRPPAPAPPATASRADAPRRRLEPAKPALALTTAAYQDGTAVDIDKRDANDPLCVTSYVREIYQHCRQQEHRAVVGDYMGSQPAINPRMRAILVDWLCSVHHKFKCEPETLYRTVSILDRYLAQRAASRKELQLIGTTAMLIASKYEEIYPVELKDLVYICDHLYTKDDIIDMETQMLQTLNYQISIPTIYKFFVRYLNVGRADKEIIFVSSFVLEESLRSYDTLKYKPSQLAAAAVLVGRFKAGRHKWSPTLREYSGYREEDVLPVARAVLAANEAVPLGLAETKKRFRRSRRFSVSDIPLHSDI